MRIAYLTSQYPAPSHTFIRREVHALRKAGIDIDTFSIRPPPPAASSGERRDAETTWYVLPTGLGEILGSHLWGLGTRPARYFRTVALMCRHRVPGVRGFVWALFYFVEAIILARELERRRIVHVHNHFANAAATTGLLATHFLGCSWSVTLHGISEFDYPAGVLLPAKLRAARFVACASHFVRAQAMRVVEPEHWDKMVISRCGVDLLAMPPRQDRGHAGPLRVVSVGRLSPEKGHHGLLTAVARLAQRGLDLELLLVGDGPEEARIRQAIERLSLSGRCTLLGRLAEDEAIAVIAKADMFALASFMEGLPVVLMEALALEVPVIAPMVAGIPELVEDGRTGLLFTPGDWGQLEHCLERLGRDPELRASLGRAGRQRVERQHDIERAVTPIRACFEVDLKEASR